MVTRSEQLKILGRRLSARSREAGLDVYLLAKKAWVQPQDIERFERGEGGLGASALCRIAQELGISPASLLSSYAPEEEAREAPTVLLAGAGSGNLTALDKEALATALQRARAFVDAGRLLTVERLADRFDVKRTPSDKPHADGYKVARAVRVLLPERPGPIRDLGRLIETRFDILVVEHRFNHPLVFGAACRSGSARVIAVREQLRSETTRRFVLGHELGHHLMDLMADGATVDEHSLDGFGFWMNNSPPERRANAFSAMLLAPVDAVRAALGPPSHEGYGLEDARRLCRRGQEAFGLGFAAMAWHLHNLRYIRSGDTVRALLTVFDQGEGVTGFEQAGLDGLARRVHELRELQAVSEGRARELLDAAFVGS